MKFIEKFFNKYEHLFLEGGKYEKYRPAYMAMYTFYVYTGRKLPKKGAHIRDAVDLKRIMFTVVLGLDSPLLGSGCGMLDIHIFTRPVLRQALGNNLHTGFGKYTDDYRSMPSDWVLILLCILVAPKVT